MQAMGSVALLFIRNLRYIEGIGILRERTCYIRSQEYLHHSKSAVGSNQFSNGIGIIKYLEGRFFSFRIMILEFR
jgi:hypothetical protein